jgi:uncharacterized iron-regulated membrane protein
MLSFTGIYLAYPEGGRNFVALFAPVSPTVRNLQAPESAQPEKGISVQEAMDIARASAPQATVSGVFLPAGPRGLYRVSLNNGGDNVLVFIDRGGREVRRADAATAGGGDRFITAQRSMHEGTAFGPVGKFLIFIIGLMPTLFVITGTTMWLRKRRLKATHVTGPVASGVS